MICVDRTSRRFLSERRARVAREQRRARGFRRRGRRRDRRPGRRDAVADGDAGTDPDPDIDADVDAERRSVQTLGNPAEDPSRGDSSAASSPAFAFALAPDRPPSSAASSTRQQPAFRPTSDASLRRVPISRRSRSFFLPGMIRQRVEKKQGWSSHVRDNVFRILRADLSIYELELGTA